MSLRFDADTENVNCGSASDIDDLDPFTLMQVCRPTAIDGTAHTSFYRLVTAADVLTRERFSVNGDFQCARPYSGTWSEVVTNGAIWTQDVWGVFFWVMKGTAGQPQLFYADLGSDVAEVTYTTQTTATGTINSDATANMLIGQHGANNTRSWVGDISRTMLFGAALTLKQCESVYRNPWAAFGAGYSLLRWFELGYNGTTDVPDLSLTGAAGTITGATLSDPAPIARIWVPRSFIFVPGTTDGAGSAAGTGVATGVGASTFAADAAAAGVGSATAVGASIFAAVGSTAGVGAASGVGASESAAVGAASGVGAAAGTGASTHAGVGAAAGIGAAAAVAGASEGAGAAAGVGTASGVGASIFSAVGATAGVGVAAAVGESTHAAVGASAGVGAAAAVAELPGSGVGAAAGTGSATAVGASIFAGVGSSSGLAAASAVGRSTSASVGAAAGIGAAPGIGAATFSATGVASGMGAAAGVGTDASILVVARQGERTATVLTGSRTRSVIVSSQTDG